MGYAVKTEKSSELETAVTDRHIKSLELVCVFVYTQPFSSKKKKNFILDTFLKFFFLIK
jgi:hypothetical protein